MQDLNHIRSRSAQVDMTGSMTPEDLTLLLQDQLCTTSPRTRNRSVSIRDSWEQTIDHAIKAIVSLRIIQTRPFDCSLASHYYGTGFVVDKSRGIILTNRHLISSGPVRAKVFYCSLYFMTCRPCSVITRKSI